MAIAIDLPPTAPPEREPLWLATGRIVWPALLAVVLIVVISLLAARISDALQFGLASGSRVVKGQKTSVIHLLRHIETGDARELQLSEEAMAPANAVTATRLALIAGDDAGVRRNMALLGATEADANGRIFLYRLVAIVPALGHAFRHWSQADNLMQQQRRIGQRSAALHAGPAATPQARAALTRELLALDGTITGVTTQMNADILGAARWFRTAEFAATLAAAGGLLAFSMLVAANGVRRLLRARAAEDAHAVALRQHEQAAAELDLALNATHVALWGYEPSTGRVLHTRRWYTLLGYLEMPAQFDGWRELVHPDDRALHEQQLRAHLDGASDYVETEFRMRHAAGHWVWVRSRGRVTRRAPDGTPLEFHDAVMNISGQVAAREMQRRQSDYLQAMLECVDTGIMLSTRDRIRYVNSSLCRMLGHPKEQLIGASVTEYAATPAEAASIMERRRAALEGAELPMAVTTIMGADGRPVKLIAAVTHLRWNDESHFVSTLTPLSEYERMEDKLKTERAKFERALIGHLEAQQEHIARELHDSIGSALAGLSLLVSVARSAPEPAVAGPVLDRCQEQIQAAVEATRALTRGIMPVEEEPGALYRALDRFVHDLGEGQKVEVALRAEESDFDRLPPRAACHIYRIVQEAVSNALRHGRATRISIEAARSEQELALSITDNGVGLGGAVDRQDGIGLRSMRARAQILGGTLRVGNAPSGGARVDLRLR